MLKAGCEGNNGENGYSVQSMYIVAKVKDSKWLIWLVCMESYLLQTFTVFMAKKV